VSGARQDSVDTRFVVGDVVVYDNDTIDTVERHDMKELSAGYRTTLKPVPGGVHRKDGCPLDGTYADFYQTEIKYNHVALLPAGRANEGLKGRPVRLRLDGAGDQLPEEEEHSKMATIKIDGKSEEVSDSVATAFAALEAKTSKRADSEAPDERFRQLEDRLSKAEARADAAEQQVSEMQTAAESADQQRDDEALFELRKEAEKVTELAAAELVKLDAAGLRRAILRKLAPSVEASKLDDAAYVEARLDHIRDSRDSSNSMRDPALRGGGRESKKEDGALDSPYIKVVKERTERQTQAEN